MTRRDGFHFPRFLLRTRLTKTCPERKREYTIKRKAPALPQKPEAVTRTAAAARQPYSSIRPPAVKKVRYFSYAPLCQSTRVEAKTVSIALGGFLIAAVSVILSYIVAKKYGDLAAVDATRKFHEKDAKRARLNALGSLINETARIRKLAKHNSQLDPMSSDN